MGDMEPFTSPARAPAGDDAAAVRQHSPTARTALVEAGRLLSRLGALTSAQWRDALQCAHTLDAAEYRQALERMTRALAGHPQTRALDALNRGACAAANGAVTGTMPDDPSVQACTYAGRVAARAVLALALSAELPAGDVALLTAPFRAAADRSVSPVTVGRAD